MSTSYSFVESNSHNYDGVSATWLWLMVILIYVVGDGVTTSIGFHVGAIEKNSVAMFFIYNLGFLEAFVLIKGVVILWTLFCYKTMPEKYKFACPGALVLVGGIVLWINTRVILTLLLS